MIDREIDIFKKSLEKYSPSGREWNLAKFLLEEIKRNGLDGYIDKIGNVILKKTPRKYKKTLLLCSHMDTVSGEIKVKVKSNKLYGRGAVDAKGSLISMFLAALGSNPKNIQLIFAGVVQEEGDSRGIKQLMKDIKADYAVFGEPSGLNNITIGYKGSIYLEKIFSAEKMHPSNFEKMNAVEEAMKTVGELEKKMEKFRSDSIYENVTLRITEISGNGEMCKVVLNARFPPSIPIEKIRKLFPGFEILDETPAYLADRKNSVVIQMRRAIKNVTDRGTALIKKTGTGDMNLYFTVCKNCITYGPGDSRLDHSDNENIDLKEFLTSTKVYEKFIEMVDEECR